MLRRGFVVLFAGVGLAFAAAPAQAVEQTVVTIDSAVLLSPFEIQVTGTILCEGRDLDSDFFIEPVTVTQGPTQRQALATGSLHDFCGGPVNVWTVTATGSGVPFHPGVARVVAFGIERDIDGSSSDEASRSVVIGSG